MLTEARQIATGRTVSYTHLDVYKRQQVDTLPVENYRAGFKMVDTCAAEFSANTPYFYSCLLYTSRCV